MNLDLLAYAILAIVGLGFVCWFIEVLIWLFNPSYNIIRSLFK